MADTFRSREALGQQSPPGTDERSGLVSVRLGLVLTDTLLVSVAVVIAQLLRFGAGPSQIAGVDVDYTVLSCGLVLAWLAALASSGAYRPSVLGYGPQELRAVMHAAVGLFAAIALLSFAFQLLVARGYVLVAFPLGLVLTCTGRVLWRRHLVRARRRGRLQRSVLAVGGAGQLTELVAALQREPAAGYVVRGVCCDEGVTAVRGVPVIGPENDVAAVARRGGFDVVAWGGSRQGPTGLRSLVWDLEDTEVEVVVMSDLTEVADPRVVPQAISGVPFLHLQAPRFGGARLIVKTTLDYVLAIALVVLTLPVQVVIALAVVLADRGPVFYSQTRVGVHGRPFRMIKFRTMVVDADQGRSALDASPEQRSGPLFKMRHDPRITRVGRVLRRFSLDELPQLYNVLGGHMSLVGPRPALPHEVTGYSRDLARRRPTVRPGMTGLWQVSGRSNLTWEETTRLDLYYVDNWSVTGDLAILVQTVGAVLRGRGAY